MCDLKHKTQISLNNYKLEDHANYINTTNITQTMSSEANEISSDYYQQNISTSIYNVTINETDMVQRMDGFFGNKTN